MGADQLRAVREDYDRRAPRWERVYGGSSLHDSVIQQRFEATVAALGGGLPAGGVLDVGCGAGQLVDALAEAGRPAWGCDISLRQAQSASRRAQRSSPPAAVCQADAAGLPFATSSFAAVASLGAIQYLSDPDAGVTEMARVVRPGGRVVASVPNLLRLSILADPVGALRRRINPEHRGYRRRLFTRRRLRRLLERHGLRVESIDGFGFGPFTLLGLPLTGEPTSVALDRRIRRRLPAAVAGRLGAELVAVAAAPAGGADR